MPGDNKRGQGRPLGSLAAWLQCDCGALDEVEGRNFHMHKKKKFFYAVRKEARKWLKKKAEEKQKQTLFDHELDKDPKDSDEEPKKVP